MTTGLAMATLDDGVVKPHLTLSERKREQTWVQGRNRGAAGVRKHRAGCTAIP
jgi:hypothetical protein